MKCSIPSEFISTRGSRLKRNLKSSPTVQEVAWMLTGVYQVVRIFFLCTLITVEWFIILKDSLQQWNLNWTLNSLPELEPELSTLPVTWNVWTRELCFQSCSFKYQSRYVQTCSTARLHNHQLYHLTILIAS